MKKIINIILVLGLCFTLGACSAKDINEVDAPLWLFDMFFLNQDVHVYSTRVIDFDENGSEKVIIAPIKNDTSRGIVSFKYLFVVWFDVPTSIPGEYRNYYIYDEIEVEEKIKAHEVGGYYAGVKEFYNGEKINDYRVIVSEYTATDGEVWVNPLAEEFAQIYSEGKKHEQSDKFTMIVEENSLFKEAEMVYNDYNYPIFTYKQYAKIAKEQDVFMNYTNIINNSNNQAHLDLKVIAEDLDALENLEFTFVAFDQNDELIPLKLKGASEYEWVNKKTFTNVEDVANGVDLQSPSYISYIKCIVNQCNIAETEWINPANFEFNFVMRYKAKLDVEF